MSGSNQFWPRLRQLADAYEAEGMNAEERMEKVLAEFRRMPDLNRRKVLNDFRQLAHDFPDLFALTVAADRVAKQNLKARRGKDIA